MKIYKNNILYRLKYHYPVLVIFALVFVFFAKAIVGLNLIVAGDFSGSDLLDLHYPFKAAIHDALANHYLPLWTPYLDGGYPLFAEGQMGFFYPVNLLVGLLPPFLALNYSIIIAFLFASFFTFLYARSIGLDPFSSLVAAITFMFSAFFIARIKHINLIAVSSLFPLGLFFVEKFWQGLRIRNLILLGLILGLQLLAGHPQMAFYCLLIYLWAFFFKLAFYKKTKEDLPLGKIITGIFLAGVVAVGIGAIQLLPTLEMTILSSRPGYIFEQIAMYPYHPKNLITFFSPYFFGNPATGTYRENIRQMGIFWENANYVGILPLVLALFTIFVFLRRGQLLDQERRQKILFFILTAFFSLLLILGRFTPIFSILIKMVPLARLFRFPTRFNLFVAFSLAILAGFGVELLLKNLFQKNPKRRFTWPLPLDRTKILIVFLIVVDLFVFGQDYIGSIQTSQWLKNPQSVEFFEKDQELFRIYSVSQYSESPYQTLGWERSVKPLVAIKEAVPPNANITYKIGTISDRSWFEGGLPVLRHYQFEKWLLNEVKDEFMLGKILGMFNVKYLLTYAQTENPEMKLEKEINLGEEFGTTLKIYENDQNMPRVYFVPEAKVITNEDEILRELAEFNFYPFRTVILEKNPPFLPPAFTGILDDFKKKNKLEIEKYHPLQVIIKATLENEGFLVLSDIPYPGWKAKVDGKETEIFTANFVQRALPLKPGEHTILFFYDPLPFKIGATVSLATLLGLTTTPVLLYLKKKLSQRRKRS